MKKIQFYLIALLMAGGATACENGNGNDNDGDPPVVVNESLTVDRATLAFDGEGKQSHEVEVTSELDWTATVPDADGEWIQVVPFLDETGFTVTVEPFIGDTARTSTITVTNGKNTETVAVSQGIIAYTTLTYARTTLYEWSADADLCNPFLKLSEQTLGANGAPATPCMIVCLNPVVAKPDHAERYFDMPEGTYEMKASGAAPYLYNDGYNNFAGMSNTGLGDIVDAVSGSMTITKSGDQTTAAVVLINEDGSVFKGKYVGPHITAQNPNYAVAGNFDMGTLTGGTGRTGNVGSYYSMMPSWGFRIFGPGVSASDPNDAAKRLYADGTGYYIRMETINSEAGTKGLGYVVPNGEYTVKKGDATKESYVLSGSIADTNQSCGLYIYTVQDGEVTNAIRVQSGTVKITQTTNKEDVAESITTPTTYLFEFDVHANEDGTGTEVVGSIEASLSYVDLLTGSLFK